MLRIVSAAVRGLTSRAGTATTTSALSRQAGIAKSMQERNFGILSTVVQNLNKFQTHQSSPLSNVMAKNDLLAVSPVTQIPSRTVIKFSLKKGKRKTVKAVIDRFFRLNWGIWIRPRAGRNNKLFAKKPSRRKRLRTHVFTNAKQSTLLDKMVTDYWKRPRYYVDDPYNPYHEREEFPYTRMKPKPL